MKLSVTARGFTFAVVVLAILAVVAFKTGMFMHGYQPASF